MRELTALPEVIEATGDDPLCVWAAQGLRGTSAAWEHRGAVAVAAPGLSTRDRLAVCGPPAAAASLVRDILRWRGPTFRPVGDEALVVELVARIAGLEPTEPFGWMDTGPHSIRSRNLPPGPVRVPAGDASGAGRVRWLEPCDWPEVAALLARAFPRSYALPGQPGVRRWAGLLGGDGRLVSTAADAWSAPRIGFLAGVATDPAARGRGYAEQVCRFVIADLLREFGRVGLMVDGWNSAAIGMYQRLGMTLRTIRAASARPGWPAG